MLELGRRCWGHVVEVGLGWGAALALGDVFGSFHKVVECIRGGRGCRRVCPVVGLVALKLQVNRVLTVAHRRVSSTGVALAVGGALIGGGALGTKAGKHTSACGAQAVPLPVSCCTVLVGRVRALSRAILAPMQHSKAVVGGRRIVFVGGGRIVACSCFG